MEKSDRRDLRPFLRRLRNRETGAWLHLSATGETRKIAEAWSGTKAQAQTLRARAQARGEAFPYRLAPLAEPQQTEGVMTHD